MFDSDNPAPAPGATQYAGNPLTSQLAAQQYAAGLQQQQAQNAREAALYGNANGNFDVANAAQMRGASQIVSNPHDQQRQLAALGATNTGIGNLNSTGGLLTQMGTNPMGPSYAEAQMRQGQDTAMAQQLSMARSGRTLGSGQGAMQQAMFNNAALNQQTNMGAADARIREQQNYNQFQLGALQGAGNAYGTAGNLGGLAGNQATTIRSGNEGLQAQNAALGQSQQQINNQTTGLYNQLGAQQQQLGMQANAQGQNAYQFGAGQASGALGAQLNADTGRLSSTTATNIANQNNANAHDAANMNMVSSGLGAATTLASGASAAGAPTVNANNPSGSTSQYQNITTASNAAGPKPGDPSSDERQKTNIKALQSPSSDSFTPLPAIVEPAPGQDTSGWAKGTRLDAPAPTAAPAGPVAPSYGEAIGALNQGYRASQFAPTDVLNHVPGAGAGHSASQDAVIAALSAPPGRQNTMAYAKDANAAAAAQEMGPALSGGGLSSLGHSGMARPAPGAPSVGAMKSPQAMAAAAAPIEEAAPPPAWGDVFNQPQFDPRVEAYLNGTYQAPGNSRPPTVGQVAAMKNTRDVVADGTAKYGLDFAKDVSAAYDGTPQEKVAAFQAAFKGHAFDPQYAIELAKALGIEPDHGGSGVSSDVHSKTKIRQLETQLAALSADGPPTASFAPQQPDTASLDDAYARQQNAPAVDLRPAQGFEYEYKDPHAPGAEPGRHVGPMAQDLLHTAAAGAVHNSPTGLRVDTPRLTMVNTAALSEQQRKTQELERQLAALQGSGLGAMPAHDQSLYARPGAF
jgi:hypothetical protein